jgi:hypothetical protein
MKLEDMDQVAQACAEYFSEQMTLKGWLGKALQEKGFGLADVSEADAHRIALRTIMQLSDTWDEDIEAEEDEDDFDDDDDEEEDIEDEEEEELGENDDDDQL